MIDYKNIQETLNQEIKFTPEDIAGLFCELSCQGMAEFFTEVCRISDLWQGGFPMQMQFVKDSPASTEDGRSIMRLIGDYSYD